MRLMGYWQSMLRKRLRENINLKLRENLSLIYSNKLFKRSEPLLTHIEQLVNDLCNAFFDNYDVAHQRSNVTDYNNYQLCQYNHGQGVRKSCCDGSIEE